MKALHLASLALTVAAVGLSLPARADQATVNETVQTAIVNGNGNTVNQSNSSSINSSGRRNWGNSGTVVRTIQNAEIFGNNNVVNQSSETRVGQSKYRNR
jgi:hypothetical protein